MSYVTVGAGNVDIFVRTKKFNTFQAFILCDVSLPLRRTEISPS